MSSESLPNKDADTIDVLVPAAGFAAGQIVQLSDGRAGKVMGLRAFTEGDVAGVQVSGQLTLAKTASVVCLDGSRAFWDVSANTVTPLQALGANDFYVGVFVGDSAAADETAVVALNVEPKPTIELMRGPWESTQVAATTSGAAVLTFLGGGAKLVIDTSNQAAKIDLLSVQSVLAGQPWIAEGDVAIYDVGDNAALDINIGMANASHASDADSITESIFLHLDGSALDIKAESDDGTTEVAATDTTKDAVDDTYFHFAIDARDPADVQVYINGVLVLPASVFDISKATGPLKALVHVERTTDDTPADVRVSGFTVRTTDIV